MARRQDIFERKWERREAARAEPMSARSERRAWEVEQQRWERRVSSWDALRVEHLAEKAKQKYMAEHDATNKEAGNRYEEKKRAKREAKARERAERLYADEALF